jgi:hypothetical protein
MVYANNFITKNIIPRLFWAYSVFKKRTGYRSDKVKVKVSPLQALEALGVVRG